MAKSPIGFRIRLERKALGLTQAELAKRAGISPSYLNLIEANKREIGGALLKRIADLLDVEMDALTGRAARQMITEALVRTKHPRAAEVLIDVLSDEILTGHAIHALGQLKSRKARDYIEKFRGHPNRWIRKEAKRALKKIDSSTSRNY